GIVAKIAERGGVVGLIMAQHQPNDGLRKNGDYTESLAESLEIIYAHIDRIAELTGGYDHIALGTDFDGLIKPTMGGIDTMAQLADLEAALFVIYDTEATEKMTSGNALGIFR